MCKEDEMVLIGNLIRPEQGLFVETRLEGFLGIIDRPIRGEFKV